MKLSEIRERLMAIKDRHVWIDIDISNLSSTESKIQTYDSETKAYTKHSSISAALAFVERAKADDDIEDDEPTTGSLEAMGFGVAGGDK
jgi:hypothetical protein